MCLWKPLERFEVCMEISKGTVLERPKKGADIGHQEKVRFKRRLGFTFECPKNIAYKANVAFY